MNNNRNPGKIISSILMPFIVYYLITFFVDTVFMTVLMVRHPEILNISDYEEMFNAATELTMKYRYEMLIIASAAVLPVMVRMLRDERLKDMAEGSYVLYEKPDPLAYINVAVLGISGGILLNCLIHISGIYTLLEGEEVVSSAARTWNGNLILELLSVGILSPAVEEITFRGLILHRFEKYVDARWALLGSAFIFSLAHGSSIQGMYAFAIGALAGFLYLRFRNVLAPFVLHVAVNITAVLQNEAHFLDAFTETTAGLTIICAASAALFMTYFYLVLTGVEAKPVAGQGPGTTSGSTSGSM